jgi:hypothetical protein
MIKRNDGDDEEEEGGSEAHILNTAETVVKAR